MIDQAKACPSPRDKYSIQIIENTERHSQTHTHTHIKRNQSPMFPQSRDAYFSMFSIRYLTWRVSKAQSSWFLDCVLSSVCVGEKERC